MRRRARHSYGRLTSPSLEFGFLPQLCYRALVAVKRATELARMAGLEPATTALTVRGSTIELHPNWLREPDSNRRSTAYETAAGTTPVNPAFFADAPARHGAFAPRASRVIPLNAIRRTALHPFACGGGDVPAKLVRSTANRLRLTPAEFAEAAARLNRPFATSHVR